MLSVVDRPSNGLRQLQIILTGTVRRSGGEGPKQSRRNWASIIIDKNEGVAVPRDCDMLAEKLFPAFICWECLNGVVFDEIEQGEDAAVFTH
ncbi:hypothetical protein CDAR_2901 [Caerostris darwini]|uniref:Uncharacterized protein n=1 Tax=Caerostris darwini TaxID=1538125 RepID=A0AAV4THB0_9ARAC|nr:hypothetical protein CDAR_2901 [Caerostris darwini]